MSETGPLKRAAALRALDEVSEGMVLGLGTGSTVAHFLVGLAEYLRVGRLKEIVGVPTSLWTADRCRELGIPLTSLASHPILDLTVDGTDEVDPSVNLIKGANDKASIKVRREKAAWSVDCLETIIRQEA